MPSHSRSMRTFTLDWRVTSPIWYAMKASSWLQKTLPSPFMPSALEGQVVAAKYHILSRTGNGLAVLRLEYVV